MDEMHSFKPSRTMWRMWIATAVVSIFIGQVTGARQQHYPYVTCGSLIKLVNTHFGHRLHSHEVQYGSGSGQQSVTGTETKEDINSYWQVKGKHNSICNRGEPITCGSVIRFEHLETHRNLHSHLYSSPLSSNQEVSAFGTNGSGDSGDNWVVVCTGSKWTRDQDVRLRHADTDVYLSLSGNTYGRPIHGQMEVVGVNYADRSSYWRTGEGVYVKPIEENGAGDSWHDEL